MQNIRSLIAVSVLAIVSACAPSPASGPTVAGPTAVSTVAPVLPTPALTLTTIPSTTLPTAVQPTLPTETSAPATPTRVRLPIPTNFPLATFEMTDGDGKWTLSFIADGSFETTLKGHVKVSGTFEVLDDRLTLHDVSVSKTCKPAQGDGTYKWAFDGTVFKLDGVTDKCVPRGATLSGSVWTIQP